MRRGFYGWDETELPLSALSERTRRLQEAMRVAGLDGLLIYTNIARPAAVSWLTGFTPYWSEGLLFVPPDGAPDFATALSNRVAEWMRAVTPTGSILCTPQPAKFFGERLAGERGAKRIGVPELELLPGGLAAEFMAAAPAVELVDATALFRAARQRDAAEATLFARAARIASNGFAEVASLALVEPLQALGALEKSARDARAEEVYVALAPDLSRNANFVRVDRAGEVAASFALRASVAYKSTWVRRTKSFSRDRETAKVFASLDERFEQGCADLHGAAPMGPQIASIFSAHDGARVVAWSLEACRGSYPLEYLAGDGEAANEKTSSAGAVLAVELSVQGRRWLAQRPLGIA